MDLLEQRGVLVFPKLDFNDEEQVAFTKTLAVSRERHGNDIHKPGFSDLLLPN